MREVMERQDAAAVRDARETLEPMLDDLTRALGYQRAVVLSHDVARGTLNGLFGLNVRDDLARSLSISLSRQNDPIVVALRTGAPQRVDDVAVDDRLEPDERDLLITMRVGRFVAASLPTTRDERGTSVVILSRDAEILDTDLERLLPFARQASVA